MHYPNVANGYMVWTHGDSPPWSVVFHHYGYPIGVDESPSLSPATLQIEAYPRIFDDGCDVVFTLPRSAHVRLSIYDKAGRLMSNLVDERRLAGTNSAHWNATDNTGRRVPSGTYFLWLEVEESTATEKMVLVR
jgi:hypothetical protein